MVIDARYRIAAKPSLFWKITQKICKKVAHIFELSPYMRCLTWNHPIKKYTFSGCLPKESIFNFMIKRGHYAVNSRITSCFYIKTL